MVCPECDTIMPMDSKGINYCISCGYMYNQAKAKADTSKMSYNNAELMKRVAEVNDGGEKTNCSIDETIKERDSRYGGYKQVAALSQKLKSHFSQHVNVYGQPDKFSGEMRESIEMILHKLARIATGDPEYDDNWRDIAGYAELIVKGLQNESKPD